MFAQICSKWENIFCKRLIKYFTWKNYLGQLTEGNCLRSNYPGVINQETIIQAPIIWRQLSWGNYPGGNCPGAIIQWGNCPGDNCPRTGKKIFEFSFKIFQSDENLCFIRVSFTAWNNQKQYNDKADLFIPNLFHYFWDEAASHRTSTKSVFLKCHKIDREVSVSKSVFE